jgi:hypothetical protein
MDKCDILIYYAIPHVELFVNFNFLFIFRFRLELLPASQAIEIFKHFSSLGV